MHHSGDVLLYPMATPVRRLERRPDEVINMLRVHHRVARVDDSFVTKYESSAQYLEGTGSMIFDHMARTVYACISPRTHATILADVARSLEYHAISFECRDNNGVAVYHTNVMMSIGDRFAVVAGDSIVDIGQRNNIKESLRLHGIRQVIDISLPQMASFAGNVLQLAVTSANDRFTRRSIVAMSTTAYNAFTDEQRDTMISAAGSIVAFDIPTIEMEVSPPITLYYLYVLACPYLGV
jgi:hypothetical protein